MFMELLIVLLLIALIFLLFNLTSIFHVESNDYTLLEESTILDGAQPFEHIGNNKKAVLFIHGFPGSPKMFYLIRELAVADGYDVYNPRLPGFGTVKEDLIKTNFSMWYNYIRDYYLGIRNKYDEFYIVGTSMGGAITLKLAQEFHKDHIDAPNGIAVTAAPVFLNSLMLGVIINPLIYISRVVSIFYKYIPPKRPRKSVEFDQDGDTEWVGYRGLFPKQIYSLLMGLKEINRNLEQVDLPCYLCHAKEDRTVSFKNLYHIAGKISSDNILLRVMNLNNWKHSNHSLFLYKSVGPVIWKEINSFFLENRDVF